MRTLFITLLCLMITVSAGAKEYPLASEKDIQEKGYMPGSRPGMPLGYSAKSTEERIKDAEDTLDKIYSMLADLHIKQMGAKRYEQIAFPDKYLPKVGEK